MDNNFNGENNQSDNSQQMFDGQPDMGMQPSGGQPDMNQQQFEQDMYSQPYVQQAQVGGKPPKKSLSGGKLAGIIGGCVALVAAIVCAIIFIPKLFDPKETVIDAFENTFSADKETSYTTDVIGAEEIADAIAKNGGSSHVEYGINSLAGADAFNGIAIVCDAVSDPANKLINSSIALKYQDAQVLGINFIGTTDNTYLQAPELIDGYFSLPNKDIFGALSKSPLLEEALADTDLPSFDINYFPETVASDDDAKSDSDGIWEIASVEKKGSTKVDVNGTTVKAKEYDIVIAEEDLENSINKGIDEIKTQLTADPEILSQAGLTADTLSSTFDTVKGMVPSLISGDVVVKVYVKDKKVVKLESDYSTSLMGVSLGYNFYLDKDDNNTSGKVALNVMGQEAGVTFEIKDIKSNPNGNIVLYAADEKINASFNSTVENTDTAKNITINAEASYNDKTLATVVFSNKFDKSANAFNGSIDISIPDTTNLGVTYSGSVKDIVKGKSYTIDLSSIDVNVDGQSILDMYMVIGVDSTKTGASNIDSSLPVYDITTMTTDEFTKVAEDNMEKINTWAADLESKLGGLIESLNNMSGGSMEDYDLDDEDYEEIAPEDMDDVDVNENDNTEPTTILQSGDVKVNILKSADGFTFDSGSEYYVDYYSEDYSMISYSLDTYSTPAEIVSYSYIPEEDENTKIISLVESESIDVDGEVLYCAVTYEYSDVVISQYRFVKSIGDGVNLILDYYGTEADIAAIAAGLSNSCYEIIQ